MWVQRATLPVAHDVDGRRCDCERCVTETATPPALPGQPARALEQAEITCKHELKLTRGLCHAIGVSASSDVAVIAVPGLHALLVTSPWQVLESLIGAATDPAGATATPPPNQESA